MSSSFTRLRRSPDLAGEAFLWFNASAEGKDRPGAMSLRGESQIGMAGAAGQTRANPLMHRPPNRHAITPHPGLPSCWPGALRQTRTRKRAITRLTRATFGYSIQIPSLFAISLRLYRFSVFYLKGGLNDASPYTASPHLIAIFRYAGSCRRADAISTGPGGISVPDPD